MCHSDGFVIYSSFFRRGLFLLPRQISLSCPFLCFFFVFLLFFFVVSPALGNTEFRPTFFRGQPKKLAEIGQFFFYSLPKKQKIPPSKVVQFYKTFIFALEVLRIKRRIYP